MPESTSKTDKKTKKRGTKLFNGLKKAGNAVKDTASDGWNWITETAKKPAVYTSAAAIGGFLLGAFTGKKWM